MNGLPWKILGLLVSIGLIVGGLSGGMVLRGTNSSTALVVVGFGFLAYDIYQLATHGKQKKLEQEQQKKIAEQTAFGTAASSGAPQAEAMAGYATIAVHWFKEKMGAGELTITVNGAEVGALRKDNLQVTYHTNVPYNVVGMGIYKAEVELSPGDTVEYYVAGNGIRHERTRITKGGAIPTEAASQS